MAQSQTAGYPPSPPTPRRPFLGLIRLADFFKDLPGTDTNVGKGSPQPPKVDGLS